MKCPNCGAPLSGDETFCPQCMTRLPARPIDAAPDAHAPRQKRRWLKRRADRIDLTYDDTHKVSGAPDARAPRQKRRRPRRRSLLVGLLVVVALGLIVGVLMTIVPTRQPDPLREARRLYALHRDTDAVAALERAIAQGPGTGDAYLLLGRAYLRLGLYEEAAEPFAHALHDSNLSGAALGLGQAAFHLGQDEMAEDNLTDAVARMPRSGAAHATLGALYYRQGRSTDAQAQLTEALQLDPGDAWARAYLGRTYLQLGDAAAAIPELEEALQAEPSDVECRLDLARAYAATGQHGQAAASFRQVLRRRPADLKAWTGYSAALLALDQTRKAQAALESALDDADLAEQARRAAVVAGWLHYGNEQYAAARDWFAAALTFDPQSAAAHNGLGWATLQIDGCDAARAAFEEALALQPKGWPGTQTPQAGLEACR